MHQTDIDYFGMVIRLLYCNVIDARGDAMDEGNIEGAIGYTNIACVVAPLMEYFGLFERNPDPVHLHV